MTPTSVLSDGTIRRLVERGPHPHRPVGRVDGPAGERRPAPRATRSASSTTTASTAIDLRDPPSDLTEQVIVEEGEPFVIHPGEFCLGRTEEWVELPDDIVARIEGKSLARAARADRPRDGRLLRPGLEGHADARAQRTSRASRSSSGPGLPIAQLSFMTLDRAGRAALRPPGPRQPLPRPGRGDREPLRGRPRADARPATRRRRVGSRADAQRPAPARRRGGRASRRRRPFFIAAALFAAWAIVIVRRRDALASRFPGGQTARARASSPSAPCSWSAAMATAVITA